MYSSQDPSSLRSPSHNLTPPRRSPRPHTTQSGGSTAAHGYYDDGDTIPPSGASPSSSSVLAYPVSRVAASLFRRLTSSSAASSAASSPPPSSTPSFTNLPSTQSSGPSTMSHFESIQSDFDDDFGPFEAAPVQAAPHRTASPFAPPPLTPLALKGIKASTSPSALILSKALAEEIRLLLPPRLQLATDWRLAYSVEQDGVSLGTLYSNCEIYEGKAKHGFVLVVRDGGGGTFGAYLSDPPHPSSHYYGTGECFLWRATTLPASSFLANLPPPPSADTTHAVRSTTLRSPRSSVDHHSSNGSQLFHPSNGNGHFNANYSGTSTPSNDPIMRFKAFPYSGVNDYMIYCEQQYLSVGGGDGRYGLWLDSSLEHGVSSQSMTFGNEALSEEGEKFDIVGVEVWHIST